MSWAGPRENPATGLLCPGGLGGQTLNDLTPHCLGSSSKVVELVTNGEDCFRISAFVEVTPRLEGVLAALQYGPKRPVWRFRGGIFSVGLGNLVLAKGPD